MMWKKRPPQVEPQKRIETARKGYKLVHGQVVEALPSAMFRVKLDSTGEEILGHLSGKMRIHYIKILPGDRVTLEVSDYDTTRGRITRRL